MDVGNAVNLTAAGALITCVGLFLGYIIKMQKESRAERETERREAREERERERKVALEERERERRILTDIIRTNLAHVGIGLAKNVDTQREVIHSLQEVRDGLRKVNGKTPGGG